MEFKLGRVNGGLGADARVGVVSGLGIGRQTMEAMEMSEFQKELEDLINRYSMENGSNTPDFILSEYLSSCLISYNLATNRRDKWYGFKSESINITGEVHAD